MLTSAGGISMTRQRGKAAAAALAAAAIAIAPPFVSLPVARGAVDYTWNSGNSGSYSDGTKWTPAGPPGVADNAIFSNPLAPAYTVTVPAAQHANAVQVSGDTLTLNLSGGTTTLDSASPAALLVQNNGATHSQLTITGGNLSIP